MRGHSAAHVVVLVVLWLLLSAAAGLAVFLNTSRDVTLAGHDATLRPTLTGSAVVHTGPVLPDVRFDSGGAVGVDVTLGKTDAQSTEELLRRYAVLAGAPEGQIRLVRDTVQALAVSAGLRGLALGALPVVVWLALGHDRRHYLLHHAMVSVPGAVVLGALALAVWQPWAPDEPDTVVGDWATLAEFLGPAVPLPEELDAVEVRGDVTTFQTRRLIESAVDTYDKSKVFYNDAAEAASDLPLRFPSEDETTVLLVSDRHDNIGIDRVARAVGEAAGATAVFDAGDDTSTGSTWEAFSLDSLAATFDDWDRWMVPGNHDNGDFVGSYLEDRGWTVLDGEVVEGPGGSTLLGVPDPRASGLGSWRDEGGRSFDEVATELADTVCEAEERVATVLVHDVNIADEVLERGCADLVLGGHLHVNVGPASVVGEDGSVGWSYTNGTTGGAAYAFALGSKPRRDASMTLVTYADGRPVGLQSVILQTNGVYRVEDYVELTY